MTKITTLPVIEIHGPIEVDKAGEFSYVRYPNDVHFKDWDDGAKALVITGHATGPDGKDHPMKHVVYLPRDDADRAVFLDDLIHAAKEAV